MSNHSDLSAHIGNLRTRFAHFDGIRAMTVEDMTIADEIIKAPGRHIAALVNARVLNQVDLRGFGYNNFSSAPDPVCAYFIVDTHEHQFRCECGEVRP